MINEENKRKTWIMIKKAIINGIAFLTKDNKKFHTCDGQEFLTKEEKK